jgi:lipopolysaccharide transport protein LptA
MAPSRRNSRIPWFAAALAPLLLGPGLLGVAHAVQTTCANPQIEIQADQPADIDIRNNKALLRNVVITQCDTRIEAGEARVTGGIDFENSHWAFTGNVRIKVEGGSLSSDKAVVSFRNKLIAQATITGEPAEFVQPRDDGTTSRGHAKTIEYETANGTVSFRQNAWLSDGCNEISGQALTYNIRAQRVEGQKSSVSEAGSGRIVIKIQPKGDTGNPCAKPGAEKKP